MDTLHNMKLHPNTTDRTGDRHGRLLVIGVGGVYSDGHRMWLCRCDCGNEKEVVGNRLRGKGGVRSCGCLRAEANRRKVKEDGPWNEGKSYSIQSGKRCYKTRHSWAKAVIRHYGNRCSICGWDKARCDAHHRKEKSSGGKHTIANGIVLCPNCHREHHAQ